MSSHITRRDFVKHSAGVASLSTLGCSSLANPQGSQEGVLANESPLLTQYLLMLMAYSRVTEPSQEIPVEEVDESPVWVLKRYKHKEKPRGVGGEKMWRDHFTKDGYVLYDFVIEVHSIRGGGSEFASNVLIYGGKAFAGEIGEFIGGGVVDKFGLADRESSAPTVIIANDNTLLIRGKTVWGSMFGDGGGNVEYTIHAVFIPEKHGGKLLGRFAVASIQHGEGGRKLEVQKIGFNLEAYIEQDRGN